jgi:hypothetical protein
MRIAVQKAVSPSCPTYQCAANLSLRTQTIAIFIPTRRQPVAVLLRNVEPWIVLTSNLLTMALTHLVSALDSLKDQAKDALWALSSCLCQQSAKVKINGRTCQ